MTLPFDPAEYDDRLATLVDLMELHSLDGVVLTAPEHLAYFAGYLAQWPWAGAGLVVTTSDAVFLHPTGGVGAACPVRAVDGLWPAVAAQLGTGRALGLEAGHLSMTEADALNGHLRLKRGMDVSPVLRQVLLPRSAAEVALVRALSQVLAASVALPAPRAAQRHAEDALDARYPDLPVQVQASASDGILRLHASVAGYGAQIARPVSGTVAEGGAVLQPTGWPLAHLSPPAADVVPEEGTLCLRRSAGDRVVDMVLITATGQDVLTQA